MSYSVRAQGRKDRVIRSFSVGLYSKLVGAAVSFLMVPLAARYLGAEKYGLWVAASSLMAMLSFLDGGAGNAVVNMVSHSTGSGTSRPISVIVSSGFFALSALALVGMALFLLLYGHVPWDWLFGLPEASNSNELMPLVLIIGTAFFLNMPASVVGSVQCGFQQTNIQAFWMAKGRIFSLILVWGAIQADAGLIGFASAVVLGPILAAIINNGYYFLYKKPEIRPRISCVEQDTVHEIFRVGGLFLVLQFVSTLQSLGGNIIISNMLGPAAVPEYSISMQLMMFLPMFMGLLWAPLWPAYREALASGDGQWVAKIFGKSIKLAIAVSIPSAMFLIAFGQQIIRLWAGDTYVPSVLLLMGCAGWMLISILGNAIAMFLNAIQAVKIQIYIAIATSLANIVGSILFIKHVGVAGAVYASIASYIFCAAIPLSYFIPRFLRKITENSEFDINK